MSYDDQTNDKGEWKRWTTEYRAFPSKEEVRPGRLAVYGPVACPWASRVNALLGMLGLWEAVEYVYCAPVFGKIGTKEDGSDLVGWVFDDEHPDTVNGCKTLKEVYELNNPEHNSRNTTPMLFDKEAKKVLHNESQIMAKLIYDNCRHLGKHPEVELYPEGSDDEMKRIYDELYEPLLNGVYKAGFSTTQEALDKATEPMFELLAKLDEKLGKQRFLYGDGKKFTIADIYLFPTLLRFDFIYHIHFKCSFKRIQDHPNLREYVKEIWQFPHVVQKANALDPTIQHYYRSHTGINPGSRIARVDRAWLSEPAKRDHLPQDEPWWFMKK